MSGPVRSAVVIAHLLGVDGYSDRVHTMVTAYWKNRVMEPARGKNIERIEKRFHDLVTALDLTDKERLVLGKFISLRSQMSFDSGLRIGLTAHAKANDKACSRSDILER